MKVQVTFTVDVTPMENDADFQKRVETDQKYRANVLCAVNESVYNALSHAQQEGHENDMRDEISILMDSEIWSKLEE